MPLTTVEDVVNVALREVGYPRPISDIYEGSRASRAALEIYGETRDEVLRDHDWPFAARDAALAVNGQAPPAGWAFEFSYPVDCIRLRNVKPTAIALPALDPSPILFTEWNDNRLPIPIKVILTNAAQVTAVYTARITDPATWEPGFFAMLVQRLAPRLAAALGIDVKGRGQEPVVAMTAEVSSAAPPNDMVSPMPSPGR